MSGGPATPLLGAPSLRPALLRAGVSGGLLTAVLWWLPTGELLAAMARVPAGVWLGVAAGFLGGHAVSALKWRLLVGATGVVMSIPLALRAHALGLFANLCLPSLVGGDVVRAGLAVRAHGRAEAVAFASLGDRVNDTGALVLLAGLGALLCGATDGGPGAGGAALQALVLVALLLPLGVAAGVLAIRWLPASRLPEALGGVVGRLREAQRALGARPGAAAGALALSVAIQGGFVALNVWLARAIGIDQPAAVWLLAWPLAKLVALVPVSLGGIGVREVALAALLAPFGVAAAAAVAQSLAWEVLLVGSGLVAGGTALWLGGRHGEPAAAEPAP